MATDCDKLSPEASRIFELLKPHFPPDSWNRPMWQEEGIVENNGKFDLRKSEDRNKLTTRTLATLGTFVEISGDAYRKEKGSLEGFEVKYFGRMIRHELELLFILRELDFQIETLDLINS